MMKHLFTAAALLVLVSGCYYTEIASGGSSPEMQEWEKMILESYPGHVPPKTTNRSYRGNKAETRYSTVKVDKLKPMDDLDPRPAAQEQTGVKELSEPKAEEPAIKEVKPEGEPKAWRVGFDGEQPLSMQRISCVRRLMPRTWVAPR